MSLRQMLFVSVFIINKIYYLPDPTANCRVVLLVSSSAPSCASFSLFPFALSICAWGQGDGHRGKWANMGMGEVGKYGQVSHIFDLTACHPPCRSHCSPPPCPLTSSQSACVRVATIVVMLAYLPKSPQILHGLIYCNKKQITTNLVIKHIINYKLSPQTYYKSLISSDSTAQCSTTELHPLCRE